MSTEELSKFLGRYGGIEPPQDPKDASTDGQLKSLTTFLATTLDHTGSVLDVGAGRGALLARLVDLEGFKKSDIEYFAVDDEQHHRDIVGIGLGAGIHKRISVLPLAEFYREWPRLPAGKPPIVIIRNVFHELGIRQTAELIHHLVEHLPVGSTVVVQDLAVFPVAEKGNACWDSRRLRSVFESAGFLCTHVDEPTRSGNLWFNLIATKAAASPASKEAVLQAVVDCRVGQWRAWAESGALTLIELPRDDRVAKIDFDLQFAALTLQLLDVDPASVQPLTRKQEQMAAMEAFERALGGVSLADSYDSADIPPVRHFKDRANSQDKLQEFLAGRNPIAAIGGSALMGKSALVQHVLSSFAHRRKMVHVDALSSWSSWNLLESIFSAYGVGVPQEVVGRLQHVQLSTVVESVAAFAARVAPRSILVIDHFERLLGPKDRIDPELRELLSLWAKVDGAKVILTSRRLVPGGLLPDIVIELDHPPVGRFPQGFHVENILSMFVPLNDFPAAFIEAIDRHPLLAELAGRILEKEGHEALHDPTLQAQLRDKLRNKLMERASTELARPALHALMHTRRAVPRSVAESVAGRVSVAEALETGVAYEFATSSGASLVSCIRGFRFDHAEEDDQSVLPDHAIRIHETWARHLALHYKTVDDDPQWLREAYYHTAVSGSPQALKAFGRMHRSELQDAGEYWFRRGKDFSNALWAFRRVEELSQDVDPVVKMRIASCLIRTGNAQPGLDMFAELFEQYPEWTGVRSSCVDGLLYLRRFADALRVLQGFVDYAALNSEQDSWHLGQYGRAHLGLQQFSEAVDAFSRQLRLDRSPVVYRALARAYHRLGRRREAGRVLERGYRDHPDSTAMLAAFASWLQANGAPERAIELLEPVLKSEADNAWIAFAYVQALIACGRADEARRHLDHCGRELTPRFMRLTVEATVLKAEGHYESALRLLDSSSEDQHDSDARVGQRAEVFVAWAERAESDDARRVASQGLVELAAASRNLLINVSVLKLCLLARDRPRFEATLALCKEVNAKSEDVAHLEDEARRTWSSSS